MSFSTDLDAVRERAGIPIVRRLHCPADDTTFITISEQRARRFIMQHTGIAQAPDDFAGIYLEGPGRFRIKRFPLGSSTDPVWPWRVTDAERPGVFGRARTHAAAIALVGMMQAHPGEHAAVTDEDDETIAYVTGTLKGSPTATQWLHELEAARSRASRCTCGVLAEDELGDPFCPVHGRA